MIRHAFYAAAAAIPLLPVTMIQPALIALLMTVVGGTTLPASHMTATLGCAVPLTAIAAPADPKHRPAIWVPAKPLPENNFPRNRHPHLHAAFDNGSGSCQGKTYSGLSSSWHEGRLQRTPAARYSGGFFLIPPSPGNTLQLPAPLTMIDR